MATDENPVLHMVLEKGIVKIQTFPEKAPNTVKRIIELSESGFYDGLHFIESFLDLWLKVEIPMVMELVEAVKILKLNLMILKHERGIVSMARANDPDSADSQFFICYDSVIHFWMVNIQFGVKLLME